MTAPLVFLDTETTGLSLDDDIWEFAAIRRDPDGAATTWHFFVDHDREKAARMPDRFRRDRDLRFDPSAALSRADAAREVHGATFGGAHIVGAVPNFDTERLALLLGRHGFDPGWHYHLIDVENLAVGWLYGYAHGLETGIDGAIALPWDSDELSRACGVEPPPEDERHTALGDARWAMRLYDAITGGAQ